MPIALATPIQRNPSVHLSVRDINISMHPVSVTITWVVLDTAGDHVGGGSDMLTDAEAMAFLSAPSVGPMGRHIKHLVYARIMANHPEFFGTEDTAL